jgi:tetratricopeptide (TPR) repeat protein
LLLGESLIAQSRHAEAIEAYDEARSVRASRGLREVNGFDLNFIPSLFEQERHEDVLLLFDAASETPNFGLWERDSLILSALFAAEALGRREQAIRIVEEVEERRPDLAKKEHFQDVKQEILLLDPDAPLGEH